MANYARAIHAPPSNFSHHYISNNRLALGMDWRGRLFRAWYSLHYYGIRTLSIFSLSDHCRPALSCGNSISAQLDF